MSPEEDEAPEEDEVVTSSPLDDSALDTEDDPGPVVLGPAVAPGPAPPAPPAPTKTSPLAQPMNAETKAKSVTETPRRRLTAHLREAGDERVPGDSVSPMGSPVNTPRRGASPRAFCGAGRGVLVASTVTSETSWQQKIRGRRRSA